MDFREHELVWTGEKTQRFWDWMSNEPVFSDLYFSKVFGEAIVDFAIRHGKLPRSGAVLDFGCGRGHLIENLLQAGFACSGAEFSPATIKEAVSRVGNHPLFRGITHIEQLPIPKLEGSFDFVFSVEIVEHLSTEALDGTIREMYRLLKRGGRVMVTTPHREPLRAKSTICADCGAIFHPMQHLKSWTEDSLRAEMESRGFRTLLCKGVTLLNPGLEANLIHFLQSARKILMRIPPKNENLIYVGEK